MKVVRGKRRRRVSPESLRQVQNALDAYKKEVNDTDLAPATKQTYIQHADSFVRWLNGDFKPGSRL